MNEANYFIFRCSSYKKKIRCYIFKAPQEDDEWNYKWRKDTDGENPKIVSLSGKCIILIKGVYKIITPLFLQKSLDAYRNTGIQ